MPPVTPSSVAAHPRPESHTIRKIHRQMLRGLAARHTPIDAMYDHEDVAQSTWLRLLERPNAYAGRSSFPTFAIGVAMNVQREVWVRALRRRRIGQQHREHLANTFGGGCHDPADAELPCATLGAALDRLDAAERWLVEQRLVHDRMYDDILPEFRARFSTNVTTREGLRTLVFRARHYLQSMLADASRP